MTGMSCRRTPSCLHIYNYYAYTLYLFAPILLWYGLFFIGKLISNATDLSCIEISVPSWFSNRLACLHGIAPNFPSGDK